MPHRGILVDVEKTSGKSPASLVGLTAALDKQHVEPQAIITKYDAVGSDGRVRVTVTELSFHGVTSFLDKEHLQLLRVAGSIECDCCKWNDRVTGLAPTVNLVLENDVARALLDLHGGHHRGLVGLGE